MSERDGKPSGGARCLTMASGSRGTAKAESKAQNEAESQGESKSQGACGRRGNRLATRKHANQCLYRGHPTVAAALGANTGAGYAGCVGFAPGTVKVIGCYGASWRLVIRQTPEVVPHSVAQLPALPAGLVHPAEVGPARNLNPMAGSPLRRPSNRRQFADQTARRAGLLHSCWAALESACATDRRRDRQSD